MVTVFLWPTSSPSGMFAAKRNMTNARRDETP